MTATHGQAASGGTPGRTARHADSNTPTPAIQPKITPPRQEVTPGNRGPLGRLEDGTEPGSACGGHAAPGTSGSSELDDGAAFLLAQQVTLVGLRDCVILLDEDTADEVWSMLVQVLTGQREIFIDTVAILNQRYAEREQHRAEAVRSGGAS